MSPVVILEKPNVESRQSKGPTKKQPEAEVKKGRKYKANDTDLQNFTKNLQTQISSGVTLLKALELHGEHGEGDLAAVSKHLTRLLTQGSSFSEALAHFPNIFSPLYQSLIKAGEHAGKLDKMLGELSSYLEWKIGIKKTVLKATAYPLFVISLTFLVILFVLGFVFPRLSNLFQKMGTKVPTHVKILIEVGKFVSSYWYLILLGTCGLILAVYLASRSKTGKTAVSKVLLHLPLFGKVFKTLELARFMRTLSILESSGIPLVKALELTKGIITIPIMANALEKIESETVQGETFTNALYSTGIMHPMVVNLVSVGEESGKLSESLKRLADHFDREAKEKVAKALSLLEPVMILLIGIFVAVIAGSVISTLYKSIMMAGR